MTNPALLRDLAQIMSTPGKRRDNRRVGEALGWRLDVDPIGTAAWKDPATGDFSYSMPRFFSDLEHANRLWAPLAAIGWQLEITVQPDRSTKARGVRLARVEEVSAFDECTARVTIALLCTAANMETKQNG